MASTDDRRTPFDLYGEADARVRDTPKCTHSRWDSTQEMWRCFDCGTAVRLAGMFAEPRSVFLAMFGVRHG